MSMELRALASFPVGVTRAARRAAPTMLVLAAVIFAGVTTLSARDAGQPAALAPIKGPLTVTLNAFPTMGPAPLTVGFYPSIADPEGAQIQMYTWTFGDGTQSSTPPIVVNLKTYTRPGTYVATLTVVTDDGRTASGFIGINVGVKAN